MTREQAEQLARDVGFDHWGVFQVDALKFLPEVRAACEANKCGAYDKRWSCPPACGSLEECEEKAREYSWGVLLQTTGQMEDDFDVEAMFDADQLQKERFETFCAGLAEDEKHLPLGAGSCGICEKCTYPDAPCRFPQRQHPSMEAFGLLVTDVCTAAGTAYYYGPKTITYTCCVLFP